MCFVHCNFYFALIKCGLQLILIKIENYGLIRNNEISLTEKGDNFTIDFQQPTKVSEVIVQR